VTGDRTWRARERGERLEELQPVLMSGRRAHPELVESVFEPRLARRGSAKRETQPTPLAVLRDVSTWWKLRRAEGLSKPDTVRHALTIVDAVLAT
jgi:hypothetical protein